MNIKRYLIAVVCVFLGVFAYEFFVHGVLLKSTYEATSHLWRPQDGTQMEYMKFMTMSQFLFAVVLSFLYTRNYEAKGISEGIRFGFLAGLLLASIELGTYCYLPIEFSLTASWMGASLGKGLLSGVILALTYKQTA